MSGKVNSNAFSTFGRHLEVCVICSKSVSPLEKHTINFDNVDWTCHKSCFKCKTCKNFLTEELKVDKLEENKIEFYCIKDYEHLLTEREGINSILSPGQNAIIMMKSELIGANEDSLLKVTNQEKNSPTRSKSPTSVDERQAELDRQMKQIEDNISSISSKHKRKLTIRMQSNLDQEMNRPTSPTLTHVLNSSSRPTSPTLTHSRPTSPLTLGDSSIERPSSPTTSNSQSGSNESGIGSYNSSAEELPGKIETDSPSAQRKDAGTTKSSKRPHRLTKYFFGGKKANDNDPISHLPSLDHYLERQASKRLLRAPTVKQSESLEETIRTKWSKPADKLPIHCDLPRLIKHIEIVTTEGEKIITRPEDEQSPFGLTRKTLRNFMETIAIELGDTKQVLPNIIQHFNAEEGIETSDLSVEMKLFISQYMTEESSTLRLLKCITQTIIAAPFIELKNQFADIQCGFVDITGTWQIRIQFGPGDGSPADKVTISHSKGGRSADKQSPDWFEFVWELSLEFDRHMRDVKQIDLTIPYINFSETYPRDKRKDIKKLIDKWNGSSSKASNLLNKKEVRSEPLLIKRPSLEQLNLISSPTLSVRAETSGEKKFIVELLGLTPLYSQWGTAVDKNKVKDRLIALSEYRLFVISRNTRGKKKVSNVGHIFNLLGLSIMDKDKIKIRYSEFTLEFTSPGVEKVIPEMLIASFQKIAHCLPENRRKLDLENLLHERGDTGLLLHFPQLDDDSGRGIIEAYKAYADFHSCTVHKPFIAYVTALAASGRRDIRFDECVGVEQSTFDLVPIASALMHNTFFKAIIVNDINRRDAVVKLSPIFEHNKYINRIVFSGLGAEDGFVELGNALKANKYALISELDLSGNYIKEKGIMGIADALISMRNLRRFSLRNCGITGAGIAVIMKALSTNSKVSSILEEFDIGKNLLGSIGSAAISNWLIIRAKDSKEGSRLKKLSIAGCQLDFYPFFTAFQTSSFNDTIEHLDLSENRFEAIGIDGLTAFIRAATQLKSLILTGCGLNNHVAGLSNIFTSLSENSKLSNVTLNISDNSLGQPALPRITAEAIRNSKRVTNWIFAKNSFRHSDLIEIIKAVAENLTIKGLDISYNKCSSTSKKLPLILENIRQLMGEQSELTSLNIAGMELGKDLAVVFDGLLLNKKLQKLDITKNHCGDIGAAAIGEALRYNKTLISLHWDQNGITLEGWRTFLECISSNKVLHESDLPQYDIDKVITASKDKHTTQKEVAAVMLKIREILKGNRPKLTAVKSLGISEEQNPNYKESMEDVHLYIDKFAGSEGNMFLGIYDGHSGTEVAQLVKKILHQNFSVHMSLNKADSIENTFKASYLKTNKQVLEYCDPQIGCTAVNVFIRRNPNGERWIHCANIGSAHAVLCRNGKAFKLSYDHKTTDPAEIQRITKEGGEIVDQKLGGALRVTRAFGNKFLTTPGLLAEPHVATINLTSEDTHLVIASSGLWEVLSEQAVVDLVKNSTDAQKMSDKLVYYALEKGSTDNITTMVLIL